MYARVRDKKTLKEGLVTPKAYSLIPNRYILLGYEDAEGNPVDGPSNPQRSVEKKRVKDVAPAVAKAEPRLTREDLDRMNQEALDRAKEKQDELAKSQLLEYKPPVVETEFVGSGDPNAPEPIVVNVEDKQPEMVVSKKPSSATKIKSVSKPKKK
jgi:hypothetical protein